MNYGIYLQAEKMGELSMLQEHLDDVQLKQAKGDCSC